MNILMISTIDKAGGAGRAAYRLFGGLKKIADIPLMIFKRKHTDIDL